MKTWKRALALVLALVMALSLVALPSFAEGDDGRDKYNVIINYVFADGQTAAPSWTATIAAGSDLDRTVTSPAVVGYTADQAEVHVDVKNIQKDKIYTVTYNPAEVEFTVKHYWQNLNDDEYTLHETVSKKGLTKSPVGAGLAKTYKGFTALLYDTTTEIAADGSTVVEIKYDRNYFLLGLDLAGGWGAEPIYARYGTPVKVTDPTKPGYTFGGWNPALPGTITGDSTHAAQWNAGTANYTVQYWQENADDDGYSLARKSNNPDEPDVEIKTGTVGTKVSGSDARRYEGFTYNGGKTDTNVEIKGDGSTVVNVYYKRNVYTVNFYNTSEKEYTQLRITAKYGANINAKWPTYSNSSTWIVDNGSWSRGPYQANIFTMPLGGAKFYGPKTSSDSESASYYVQVLPGETGTETKNGVSYKIDHTDVTAGSGFSVTSEDQYEMTGYTFNASDSTKTGKDYDGAKFYYTRNQYNLTFNDNYGGTVTDTLYYQQPLNASAHYQAGYEPDYPAALPVGAYTFGGWYKDPGYTDPVDWNSTMPAQNQVVYAKWTPVVFQVTYAKNENETPEHQESVNYGELAKGYTTDNGLYTFVGWFYRDADGTEHAFDPTSMPVTKNMNLYAKWRSNVLVPYTIRYTLTNGTVIAAETTGSALAGTTKTFNAKAGTELNEGYQTGYFPQVSSHSITMDINGGNEFTFFYVPREKVNYTVRYLEKDTNKVLKTEKKDSTSAAVVTEKFETVPGYAPDAYQKRLVLSAEEESNVITFWYVKDTEHAPVQIIHWVQNIAGDGYTEYSSSTNLNGEIGKAYTAEWLTIAGFAKNEAKSNTSGTLGADGLVLNLYYDRIEYPYEFRFVNSYTGEDITDYTFPGATKGNARFGDRVTYTAPERLGDLGYKLDTAKSSASQAIDIRIEDPANVAKLNVKTFYYIPYFNVVHVQRDPATENVTRTPNEVDLTTSIVDNRYDLTAQVAAGYLYGGSFSDEACTVVQEYGAENPTSFTPTRGQTYYIWEVPDTYLRPSNYRVARHIDGVQTLCKLYPLTTADRLLYKEVGFSAYFGTDTASVVDIKSGSNNDEFELPVANPGAATVYQMVKAARNGKVETTVYVMDGKLSSVNADITDGTANGKPIDPGYIGGARLTDDQFAQFKTDGGITYTPYWITLDGVKVTGTMQRNLTFDASKPNVAQIKRIPVATTCTYVEDTPAVRLLNFATAFNMDDSQTTVDTRITVTVQDGASTYTTKVQPGDPVELTPNGQDGKLFAGWYVDGKASDLSGFTADTTVVAKYVDGSYLDLDYSRIGLLRVRGVTLISAVDDEDNYQEVGIMVNGEPVSSVRFASRYMLFNTPSSMFGVARGSRFVIADQSLYGSGALEVTPYWITMDGTTVLGQSHTLHYTSRSIWE